MNDALAALPAGWTWTEARTTTTHPVVALSSYDDATWFLIAPTHTTPRWVPLDAGTLNPPGSNP